MQTAGGPIRSILFVPGDNARMQEKCFATAADALIFDLEDAVAADRKQEARLLTAGTLRDRSRDTLVFVRVNAFDTGMTLTDLCAVLPSAPDGIVLPKCNGAEDIRKLDWQLDALEAAFGLAMGGTAIFPIVTETPAAVLSLDRLAVSCDRLWGVMWGAEDLSAAIGAAGPRIDGEYGGVALMARNLTLLAARAAGVVPVDAVYTNIRDLDGLEREARMARRDGFAAKAVIHPSHVDIVNQAFRPSEEELAKAKRIVEAMERAGAGGAIRLDGEMVDVPHYKAALALIGRG